jgi:hypothetical protein
VTLALRVARAGYELACIGGLLGLALASSPFWIAWLVGRWRKARRQ